MRAAIRTSVAVGSARATRRDLLLEGACPESPTRRSRSFESALPRDGSSVLAPLAVVVAPVARSADADPASHGRSLASRRRKPILARSLAATAWPTTYRSSLSRSHPAYGGRELSLGSAADPRRIAEARNHHFRTHRLALSERPPDDPVTNLADIRREPLWWPDILADDVRGFGRRGDRRRRV